MCRIVRKTLSLVASLVLSAIFSFAAQAATTTVPVPGAAAFDHTKTGFILRDVHTTLKCEQCHVGGVFKNTPKDCAGCHSIGSRVGATPKPVNHVVTTFGCDTCHNSPTSFLVKTFKHFGVVNGCATCHGVQSGQSIGVVKINPAIHIPTLLACENCHQNTNTFLSAKMDHTGIVNGCTLCHGQNGNVLFPGVKSEPVEPTAHIATNGMDCGSCHNTTTFLGATYSHVGVIAGSCGTCHGVQPGVKAMSANHIPTLGTANACDQCHTATNTAGYSSFLGALYHQNAAATVPQTPASYACVTCHTGAYPGVQGTSFYAPHSTITPGVVPACDSCHTATNTISYTTFLGATFDAAAHAKVGIVSPGLPTGPLACATCHNGTTAQTFVPPHVTVNTATTSCASCHSTSLTTMSWLGASFIHPSSVVSPSGSPAGPNACGTCHNGTNAATFVPPHVTVPITTTCDSCHTTALATLSWLGATFNHTAAGITSVAATSGSNQCATCHNGTSAQTWVAPHVATTSATACDSCHTTAMATYSWLGATFNHGAAGITSTKATSGTNLCASCHNGTAAQTWVPPHVVTTAISVCDSCHTTALSSYSWLGAAFNHAANTPPITSTQMIGTTSPACAACHNGTNAATYVPPHITVNPATTACDSCHTTTASGGFVNWLGATFNHTAAGITSTGLVTGATACSTCHNGTNAATFVPPHVAVNIATTACDSCHTTAMSTYSWLGATFNHTAAGVVTPSTVFPPNAIACATCHNGTTAQTYVQPHVNVNTATTTCDSCHKTAMSTYSWLGAVFVHPAGVVSPSALPAPDVNACGTCHNGTTASTFVAPHAGTYASVTMTAASKCDDCHTNALSTLSWTGMTMTMTGVVGTGTFVHNDVAAYPGTGCASCHSGAIALGKPATHMSTVAACDSCHTTALSTLSWLGAVGVVHTLTTTMTVGSVTVSGATNNCQKCHNGTTAKGLSTGHIPVGSMSCDGGGTGCHSANLPAALSFAPGAMGSTEHTLVAAAGTTCGTCHSGAYASQGLNLGGAVGMVSNHIPTAITGSLDCNTCHKNGFVATAGAAGWATTNGQMNHNSAQGGGPVYCVTCHLSGVTYMGLAQKKSHNGASTAKDCSVSGCHAPKGSKGKAYSSWT